MTDNMDDNTSVNSLLTSVIENANDTDNMITEMDNTLSESDNTLSNTDNIVDNTLSEDVSTLTNTDNIVNNDNEEINNVANIMLTPANNDDNIENSTVTSDNTVLKTDNNVDSTPVTIDNDTNNIDNGAINTDNSDVSKLEKMYGIRLRGANVQKIETASIATGVKPTNYVTSLIEAQLSETVPTIDLEKVRADERQKCAAQQAGMMKLYIPRATHEAEKTVLQNEVNTLQIGAKLQTEKYDKLYAEAKRLFNELAAVNKKINELPKVLERFQNEGDSPKLEAINLQDFQEIIGVITKVFVKNRFVYMHNIYTLAINLFNQTIAKKS
jgi:hypothetical protein